MFNEKIHSSAKVFYGSALHGIGGFFCLVPNGINLFLDLGNFVLVTPCDRMTMEWLIIGPTKEGKSFFLRTTYEIRGKGFALVVCQPSFGPSCCSRERDDKAMCEKNVFVIA